MAALYCWRAAGRQTWRRAAAVVLVCGLLGAVALGALAGARRTDSAYGRYLASVRSSDVFVNVPGPSLAALRQVEHLPGVRSAGAWLGLAGDPVVHGRVDDSFLADGLLGSLDGEFFRQDRMTVLAGRLPRTSARGEIALTPGLARLLGTGVGGRVTYRLSRVNLKPGAQPVAGYATFLVTGVVDLPPVLVDQFDTTSAAVLPPAATARFLAHGFGFGWAGLRLAGGPAAIAALPGKLAGPERTLEREFGVPDGAISFSIRRMDTVHRQVQQAIEPQAVALAVFGGLAAVALLVLAGQGLAQLLSGAVPAAGLAALRALGATRAQAALAAGLTGAVAIAAGMALAVAGAVAVSPLAPVGPVRRFDPARGFRADGLVLAGGGGALAALLLALLAVLAWRAAAAPAARQAAGAASRPSVLATAAAAAGLPVTAVLGLRAALERGPGPRRVPVTATLAGAAVAVLAVTAAAVFGASLDGLVTHPARYGWNWTMLMDTEGGYSSWPVRQMDRLVSGQPGVTGWSTFAFAQLAVDHQVIPVLGLTRHQGAVQPPTTSGHPLSGQDQIELGAATLRALGKRVGDTVTAGSGRQARRLTIVGTVTLPSIGLTLADHVSLGRGGMLPGSTLLALQGLSAQLTSREEHGATVADPAFPSAVAIDLKPGTSGTALAARIAGANPGGDPGGTYQQPRVLGRAIADAAQMGRQPLILALGLAAAVTVSLAAALLASVRLRRPRHALLKALGLTRGQIRATVAGQASVILVVAAAAGIPLGIAAGRWAWAAFAGSLGVAPVTVVPGLALAAGAGGLLLAGNLLAAVPAAVAARTSPAALLRAG